MDRRPASGRPRRPVGVGARGAERGRGSSAGDAPAGPRAARRPRARHTEPWRRAGCAAWRTRCSAAPPTGSGRSPTRGGSGPGVGRHRRRRRGTGSSRNSPTTTRACRTRCSPVPRRSATAPSPTRALTALDWYADHAGLSAGTLRNVGNRWHHRDAPEGWADDGDEQPIDAASAVEAMVEAWRYTGDARYGSLAGVAYEWFHGRNRIGVPTATTRGPAAATTAWTPDGVNANQGAESTLAHLQAELALLTAGLAALPDRVPVEPSADARAAVAKPEQKGTLLAADRAKSRPAVAPEPARPGRTSTMHEEAELFHRHPGNPVLSAADFPYPMNSVFNPGAACSTARRVLLARVEDRRGISHLAVARSENGRTGWRVEPKPLIADDPADPTTLLGCGGRAHHAAAGARRVRDHLHRLRSERSVRGARRDRGLQVDRAVRRDRCRRRTRTRRCCRAGSTASTCCSTGRSRRRRTGPTSGCHARATSGRGRRRNRCCSSRTGPWWDATRIGMGPPPIETPHGWLCVLPRRQADGGDLDLPGRHHAARPGGPDEGAAPHAELGARPGRRRTSGSATCRTWSSPPG